MASEAGNIGALFQVSCILNEGNITLNTGIQVAGGEISQPNVSLASEISKGDLVSWDTAAETANTYANNGPRPVVRAVADTVGACGRVVSKPMWDFNMPAASRTESSAWSTIIANREYRCATVEFFQVIAIRKVQYYHATTACEVGTTLKYDMSADAFTDNGTTHTGWYALSYAAAASTLDIAMAIVPGTATSDGGGDTDSYGVGEVDA